MSADVLAPRDSAIAREAAPDASTCCPVVSPEGDYRQYASIESGSYLEYYVTKLELGASIRSGEYTIWAPPNDESPPYVHTIELRDETGTAVATTDYHWGTTVSYSAPHTFTFENHVSISVGCNLSCSMSLWGTPNMFDGKKRLIVQCGECP